MYLKICRFSEEFAFLSNFYPAPTQLDGVTYSSVEHAYQAAKSNDPEVRKQFQSPGLSPASAKRLGRRVALSPNWETSKICVMLGLLRSKFSNPDLKQLLLSTRDAELLEGNTWGDTFWGVNLFTGEGQNQLGRLLMLVRAELRG